MKLTHWQNRQLALFSLLLALSSAEAVSPPGAVVVWGGGTPNPPGLSNVVGVAAGYDHDLALLGDGTVVAWGQDYDGQTNVPPSLSNVVAIAAGYYHNLALRRDGTVVAWVPTIMAKAMFLRG
jgi:trimeric autotransporter adhesin